LFRDERYASYNLLDQDETKTTGNVSTPVL
jgi:hypothetical protein